MDIETFRGEVERNQGNLLDLLVYFLCQQCVHKILFTVHVVGIKGLRGFHVN